MGKTYSKIILPAFGKAPMFYISETSEKYRNGAHANHRGDEDENQKNETQGKEKNRKFISFFSTSLKYHHYGKY